MITLITAVPGGGKTALAVSMLLDEGKGRPIFQMGIPELKIDHQPVPPVEEWTRLEVTPEDSSQTRAVFTFPENSIIVIDEAQNVYRPRPTGSKVPDYVKAFETHRHLGIDFWIITQSPGLIDANVRKLVGRHIHLRVTALGRFLYEGPECFDVESKSARDMCAKRRYFLPKHVYSLYKSSSLHLKVKRRLPPQFYVLIGVILLFALIFWYSKNRYNQVVSGSTGEITAGSVAGPTKEGTRAVPVLSYVESMAPAVEGLAYTAPRYADVAKPVRAPVPSACVQSSIECRCYTDQATRLNVPRDLCIQIVKNGFYQDFDPDPQRAKQVVTPGQSPVRSDAVPVSAVADSVHLDLPDGEGNPREVVSRRISG